MKAFESIKAKNLLSFGDPGIDIELGPLNVLIGPNGSGKSNFIEIFSLLQSTPTDIAGQIRRTGVVEDWLWKGSTQPPTAEIEAIIARTNGEPVIHYGLAFKSSGPYFHIVDEIIEEAQSTGDDGENLELYYKYAEGQPVINVQTYKDENAEIAGDRQLRQLKAQDILTNQSILSQMKDAKSYPELWIVSKLFQLMMFYREPNIGRFIAPRMPQATDLPSEILIDGGSNLALVINNLEYRGLKRKLVDKVKAFYSPLEDIYTRFAGGRAEVFFTESGLNAPTPASRLSDGTIHYLCLITALLSFEILSLPPSLVCIEDPELGLHPDVIPDVAEFLIEASRKTQLIITTQSDIMVDALSEYPESIVVCEREEAGTTMRRLNKDDLKEWLVRYSLGELWTKGEIGGTRW